MEHWPRASCVPLGHISLMRDRRLAFLVPRVLNRAEQDWKRFLPAKVRHQALESAKVVYQGLASFTCCEAK